MYEFVTLFGLLTIFFGGLLIAVWYGRHTKRFLWREYIAVAFLPSLAVIWAWYRIGDSVLYLYAITALAGPVLEYSLGWAYYKTMGHRMWRYGKYSFDGHTSWLVVPYWGLVGVCVLAVLPLLP